MRQPDTRDFNSPHHQANTYEIELAECRDRLQLRGHCIEGLDPEDILDLGHEVPNNKSASHWCGSLMFHGHGYGRPPSTLQNDELDRAWFARNL